MHAVALTVAEVFAVGTLVTTHPFTIAVQHIAVLPYIHEVILIDVALIVVCADAGTGSDGTVGHHGAHADAGLTGEETVTYFTLVVTQEAFAGEFGRYNAFPAGSPDKLHQADMLFTRQLQLRVLGGTSYRENGKEPPSFEAQADEKVADPGQMRIIAPVHAGNYVKLYLAGLHYHLDGGCGTLERALSAPHPIVILPQAVQADGHGPKTVLQQSLVTLRR